MTGGTDERRPYADFDREGRMRKARKIASIVSAERSLDGARVLEIGTGSGVAASLFAELVGPAGTVNAVDVHDMRIVTDGYEFQQLDGVVLPFDDGAFDVVISNHVMEHVGDEDAQILHLKEIGRVLAGGGVGYFAVPNRWRLVEPHLKLPLLSWLPERAASAYVRAAKKGTHYDVRPPGPRTMRRLFDAAGLRYREVTYEQMAVMAEVEDPKPLARLFLRSPRLVFEVVHPVISSLIYVVRPGPAPS